MTTESREAILALAGECGLDKLHIYATGTGKKYYVIDLGYPEIERFYNAARKPLEDEVERLNTVLASCGNEVVELRQQLAAAQAQIRQYREAAKALTGIRYIHEAATGPLRNALKLADQALSGKPDTSALEACIKQAGEVMRERCGKELDRLDYWYSSKAIRALPSVTMEDLQK